MAASIRQEHILDESAVSTDMPWEFESILLQRVCVSVGQA